MALYVSNENHVGKRLPIRIQVNRFVKTRAYYPQRKGAEKQHFSN